MSFDYQVPLAPRDLGRTCFPQRGVQAQMTLSLSFESRVAAAWADCAPGAAKCFKCA